MTVDVFEFVATIGRGVSIACVSGAIVLAFIGVMIWMDNQNRH